MISKLEAKVIAEKSSYYWNKEPIIDKKINLEANIKFTLVDLCCGAGGLSKGLQDTNKITPVLGVDIFTEAIKTYKFNNPNTSTILGDIRKVSEKMYIEVLGNMEIDIVAAGVPCQGFSLANSKRNINDERNFLFLEVIKFINLYEPKVIIIENVSGMRSLGKGSFEEEIKNSICNSGKYGYNVKKEILNAAEYGIPQVRKRLVFVGVRKDINKEFEFPKVQYGDNKKPFRTIRDAISDLPVLNNNEEIKEYNSLPKTEYQKLMRKNVKEKELFNHKSPKHPENTIYRIKNTKQGQPMYENYKQRIRLAWNFLSPTQLAGGIRPQFQFGHPDQPRGLSIRERARIQSFPDDFVFLGGIVQGRVQTGNAVPPLLAKKIGIEILKVLGEKNG